MATTDKRLSISELDFDDIKSNLKTFLKTYFLNSLVLTELLSDLTNISISELL